MYYMNCGGVEAALVNLLNRLNYNECIVDLYLLDACGEFLNRINKQVNIIDLTTMLHPMQKQLIITQNIYRVLDFALKNNYLLRAIKYCLLYASYKILKSEMPGFRAASVSKELVDIRYDAVFDFHGYASFTSFFGAYILKGSKKFTWCHSQNIIFDKTLKCIGKYTRMFAVSSEIKELLEQQTIRIPIDVFYNFIDIERIISDAKLGDKLNRPNDSMTLLTVGRLSPQKGYDRAIEVADILRKTGLNFKWHFCGDGDDKEQLSTLVKQYNIQDHIVFMGYQNNPYGFMASCDIYVQPSRWEGYAVTLMEAVTLHKVIVTTDVSGAKEAVIDGVNGFICNQDKNELALKIEMLMTDKQLMKTMKTNALNHNLSQLSSESKLQEVLGII